MQPYTRSLLHPLLPFHCLPLPHAAIDKDEEAALPRRPVQNGVIAAMRRQSAVMSSEDLPDEFLHHPRESDSTAVG